MAVSDQRTLLMIFITSVDRHRRFDGSMSQPQRAATVEAFGKPTKEPLVLLISLKAGGVGLNLYVKSMNQRVHFG